MGVGGGYAGHPPPSHSYTPSFLSCFLLRPTYHCLIGKWLVGAPIPLPCRIQQGRESQKYSLGLATEVWRPCPSSLPGSSFHQHRRWGGGALAGRWWACLPIPQAPLSKGATRPWEMQKLGLTLLSIWGNHCSIFPPERFYKGQKGI